MMMAGIPEENEDVEICGARVVTADTGVIGSSSSSSSPNRIEGIGTLIVGGDTELASPGRMIFGT